MKRQNTGGILAVTEGLVRQIEGLVVKFPQHFVWQKCPVSGSHWESRCCEISTQDDQQPTGWPKK